MPYRFNPPPNWPTPPAGWTPPPGWTPAPEWGPPPPGWQLWIDDAPVPAQPAPPSAVVQQPVPVRATASTAVTYTPVDTNHTFHLILTLVTFGLWAPVWFIVWAVNSSRKKKIISHTS